MKMCICKKIIIIFIKKYLNEIEIRIKKFSDDVLVSFYFGL